MFRTLLSYSSTSIGQSGQFSLQLRTEQYDSQLILVFWSGNVFNRFLLAEFTNSLTSPKGILQTISCFLAIFPTVPPLYSVMGFDERTTKTISAELVQAPTVSVIPTFSFEDLDKVLAGPAIIILDRYDHHSVLQFLLMKLRSAAGSVWLNDLPELRKVISFSFRNVLMNLILTYLYSF